jgi:hypothetical protein
MARKKLAKQCESTSIRLGWSEKRLASFQKLFAQYQRSGSIATYLKIRRTFPEAELFIFRFHSVDFTAAFDDELKRLGLDWRLIYSALDGADEPAVDALCLRLMDMLVKRDALPKNGQGHIDQRRSAINDGFLNYLMAMLLETYTNLEKPRDIPGSFVVLLRRQLCGENPDLYEMHQADFKRLLAAQLIADRLLAGEKLTVRKAAALLKISRMSAERLLASNKFQYYLDSERDGLMRYDHIPEPWQSSQLPTRRRSKADN